jgi:hypothetical protein
VLPSGGSGKFILHRKNSLTNAGTMQSLTNWRSASSDKVPCTISSFGSPRGTTPRIRLASELILGDSRFIFLFRHAVRHSRLRLRF